MWLIKEDHKTTNSEIIPSFWARVYMLWEHDQQPLLDGWMDESQHNNGMSALKAQDETALFW